MPLQPRQTGRPCAPPPPAETPPGGDRKRCSGRTCAQGDGHPYRTGFEGEGGTCVRERAAEPGRAARAHQDRFTIREAKPGAAAKVRDDGRKGRRRRWARWPRGPGGLWLRQSAQPPRGAAQVAVLHGDERAMCWQGRQAGLGTGGGHPSRRRRQPTMATTGGAAGIEPAEAAPRSPSSAAGL